jgi:hypothetical protein
MNRFCSHAPVARPKKTAHSAVATTKQVGVIDLNRRGGSVNRPYQRTSPQRESAGRIFTSSALTRQLAGSAGKPVKGYFFLSLNGDCHVVARAII